MINKYLKNYSLNRLKHQLIHSLVVKAGNLIEYNFVKAFYFQYLTNNGNLNITHALRISVFGFGRCFSNRLHGLLAFHPGARSKLLDRVHISRLDYILRRTSDLLITDKLEYSIKSSKQLYIDIHSYRGSRLVKGKPARGQSTRTNARTCKKLKSVIL